MDPGPGRQGRTPTLQRYQWDAESRLEHHSDSGTGEHTYQRDLQGQLIAEEDITYAYDDGGNRLSDNARLSQDRLLEAGNTRRRYDALGRRAWRKSEAGTTTYLWHNDVLLGEQSPNGQWQWYIRDPQTDAPLFTLINGIPYHYELDWRGMPIRLWAEDGSLAWQANADAWGKCQPEGEVHQPIRLPGQFADELTGLYNNRFRDYDPKTGRYLTPDPLGLNGGLNSYRYTRNPVDYIDPLGLENEQAVTASNAEKGEEAPIDDNVPPMQEVTPAKPDFYVGPAGAEATMPATAYRYMRYENDDGSVNKRAAQAIKEKKARLSYFGFDNHDSGDEVLDAFQIRSEKHVTDSDPEPAWSDGRLKVTFDTLQLYEDGEPNVAVPYSHGGEGDDLEPYTTAYPEYGKGGARQLVPTKETFVGAESVDVLPKDKS